MMEYAKRWSSLALAIGASTGVWAAEPPNLVPNASFEQTAEGSVLSWRIDDTMSRWVDDRAATGTRSILIEDASRTAGSSVFSTMIAVDGGKAYTVRAKSFALNGNGLGLYVRCYDSAGAYIRVPDSIAQRTLPSRRRRWKSTSFAVTLPEACTRVQVWLHSYSGSVVSACVDDLELRKGIHVASDQVPEAPVPFTRADVSFAEGPHPFLLVTADDITRIQATADTQEWARRALARFLKSAETWCAEPVVHPDRGGGWYHWYACPKDGGSLQTVSPTQHRCKRCGEMYSGEPYDTVAIMSQHNGLGSRCRDIGLAYALTGKVEFARTARKILLGYADRYNTYELHDTRGPSKRASAGRVGPQTLDESCWLIPITQGYDLVYESDLFSDADRRHIEKDLLRSAAATIRRYDAGKSNWQSWHNAGMGAVAFCLRDRELAEHVVNGSSGFQFQMANSVTDEGFWYEGAWGYHYYALMAHLALTEIAFRSGTNLYANPRYKGLYDIPIRFMAPNRQLPAFHDSGLSSGLPGTKFLEVAFRHWQDANFAWGIHQRGRAWDALLNGVPDVPEVAAPDLKSVNFSGPGFAVLRSGTTIDDMYLALDYGPHGGGHGHPDKLGFSFYALGDYVAHDPGCVAYGLPIHGQWYRQTVSHNTIVIDGQSQEQCTGQLSCFYASPGFQVVSASADRAYDPIRLARTAVMTPDYVLLVDDVSDTETHTIDWALHGVGELSSALPLTERAEAPGTNAGYEHVESVRSARTDAPWSAAWSRPLQSFRVTMAGTPETEIITGRGWSVSSLGKQPMALVRRVASNTRYVALLEPFRGPAPQTTLTEFPLEEGGIACAAHITGARHNDVFLRGSGQSTVVAGNASTDAIFAFASGTDGDVCLAFVDGTSMVRGEGRVASSSPCRLTFRQETKGLWTAQYAGPKNNALKVTSPAWQSARQAMGPPSIFGVDSSSRRGAALRGNDAEATCSFTPETSGTYEIVFPGAPSLAAFREQQHADAAAVAKAARRPAIPEFPIRPFTPPKGEQPVGRRIVVQAEDFTGQGKGEVRKTDKKVAIEGEAFLNWNDPGHWLEWSIDVTTSGVYTVVFRYCTQEEGAERAVVLDAAYPAESCRAIPFPSTGGYSNARDDWRSLALSDVAAGKPIQVYLGAGKHALRVYNLSKPVNLDYIVLEPFVEDD
ncbi:MAG: hypothetical protein HN742_29850 [Lentisphaerae bacterium]|jgi:oligo-alginate lyase|nr:hypothetical protein [Lentisphaerota bacterium]MBT4817904.1 hypothetical protein [Lentisphaerota bacterium]MBT5608296.1 hypothetical protein [Lentisphaerota bacterium]MBT7061804.1 hypothetical protein [Lentisphaerota bacterium]MBT7846113.1 hypothetical protein [Lentisphaerota bacterium]